MGRTPVLWPWSPVLYKETDWAGQGEEGEKGPPKSLLTPRNFDLR